MKKNSLICLILLMLISGCASSEVICNPTVIENEVSSEEMKRVVHSEDEESKKNEAGDLNDTIHTEPGFFREEQYRSISTYSVAPSIIEFKDQQRPENNTRWIREMSISYPMIYNIEGDNWEKEVNINKLILRELDAKYKIFSDMDYVDVKIDYELYDVNQNYMSIMFYGYYQSAQRYNDVHLSLNIDIENEKLIAIDEVIQDSIDLIALYNSGELVLLENEFGGTNEIIYTALESYNEGFYTTLDRYDFYIDDEYIALIVTANNETTHMAFGIQKEDYWKYSY